MAAGKIPRDLPFVRREGVRLMNASHATEGDALGSIEEDLHKFYAPLGRGSDPKIATAAAALRDIYRHNVFPAMNVTFGTYPDNGGHITSDGCVRCHDDSHKAKDGTAISGDCDYCHKEIEPREPTIQKK